MANADPILADLVFDRPIAADDSMGRLIEVLVEADSRWGVGAWVGNPDENAITALGADTSRVSRAVEAAALSTGPTYDQLKAEMPLPESARFGRTEMGAEGSPISLSLSIDQVPRRPSIQGTRFLNQIVLTSGDWTSESDAVELFVRACSLIRPHWGAVYQQSDYFARIVNGELPVAEARDLTRRLPALFRVNYLSARLAEELDIGSEVTDSASCWHTLGEGARLVFFGRC